jgi:glycine dehydrogenase
MAQHDSGADRFVRRHVGPRPDEITAMLETLGYESLDALVDAVVPEDIRLTRPLDLPAARIQRNILENPGWYTAYTPYQAEIAQGRLEALLNFETMLVDLTGLDIANASLLDEATAAAEAMSLTLAVSKVRGAPIYLVDESCHPQTIAVVRTRAEARGVEIVVGDPHSFDGADGVFGALVQYPSTEGRIDDFRALCTRMHDSGALVTAAADLLSLALLTPPGEWGADVAVGNAQRFGVPLGYGGPHAAYFATREAYKRPSRHGSSTSGASERPATSAQRRCCLR